MLASWTASLALIVLTTAVHSFGIVVLSLLGVRVRQFPRRRTLAYRRPSMRTRSKTQPDCCMPEDCDPKRPLIFSKLKVQSRSED